jgi:hypothetical protein
MHVELDPSQPGWLSVAWVRRFSQEPRCTLEANEDAASGKAAVRPSSDDVGITIAIGSIPLIPPNGTLFGEILRTGKALDGEASRNNLPPAAATSEPRKEDSLQFKQRILMSCCD